MQRSNKVIKWVIREVMKVKVLLPTIPMHDVLKVYLKTWKQQGWVQRLNKFMDK